MRRIVAVLILALGTLACAGAYAQSVQQSGSVTRGHLPAWAASGVVQDAGTSANPQLNAIAVYGSGGCPVSITGTTTAGAPTGQYVQGCLSASNSGVQLSVTPFGGLATQPFIININGTSYSIGGTNWLSGIFDSQFCSTQGSVLYRSASIWTCLGPGSSGQVLQTQGPNLNPQWAGSGGIGTVTSITAGTGLSGGTITTSGTIALLNPVAVNLGGTGAATLAAHGVLIGNGTTAVNVATPGVSGTVLQSNGASADPTWNSVAGTGTVTNITAADGTLTVSPSPLVTSGTIKVATNGVANANLAQMGAATIKGNATYSTANAADLTPAQASGLIALRGYMGGLVLSTAGGSATFSVAAGQATDSTAVQMMTLATISKTTGSWAVGSGNGCLDTGSISTATWYSIFVIERTDTGVTDVLCSTSATSPTFPSNYTLQRRIGSLKTDGSSHWVAFTQLGHDFIWTAPVLDANGVALQTTITNQTLASVPSGVQVRAVINVSVVGNSQVSFLYLHPTFVTDQAAGLTTNPISQIEDSTANGSGGMGQISIWTNTSQQVSTISNRSSGNYYITTVGWTDPLP